MISLEYIHTELDANYENIETKSIKDKEIKKCIYENRDIVMKTGNGFIE